MKIDNWGNPTSKIWVIIDKPYDNDTIRVFDGSYGYHFHKIMKEAGLEFTYFISSLKPDTSITYDNEVVCQDMASELNRYKPPLIIFLGAGAAGSFLPQIRSFKRPYTPRVESFAGSLLVSPYINYDHYAICTHTPDFIIGAWDYRDIQINLDLGHIREELEYHNNTGRLNPLPTYNITISPSFEELMLYLESFKNATYLSTDIETLRPRQKTTLQFKNNPGFVYLLGLASSPNTGISFSLWDYSTTECLFIFKELDYLFQNIPQIGQNYLNFDSNYLEGLGFRLCLSQCKDTRIRHHILWPELSHTLHFMTKQYTRQPYYKDEGKGFIPRNEELKKKFMYYNALDAVVTYAIFEEQEREFNERPHLK